MAMRYLWREIVMSPLVHVAIVFAFAFWFGLFLKYRTCPPEKASLIPDSYFVRKGISREQILYGDSYDYQESLTAERK